MVDKLMILYGANFKDIEYASKLITGYDIGVYLHPNNLFQQKIYGKIAIYKESFYQRDDYPRLTVPYHFYNTTLNIGKTIRICVFEINKLCLEIKCYSKDQIYFNIFNYSNYENQSVNMNVNNIPLVIFK